MRVDGKKPVQDADSKVTTIENLGSGNATTTVGRKLIHNMILLDASGSMNGPKYNNAITGINELIKSAQADEDNDNIITIMEFEANNFVYAVKSVPAKSISYYKGKGTGGMTPLNEAIGKAVKLSASTHQDKTLMTVFTDGGENSSKWPYTPDYVKTLIADNEPKGLTVAFVGTAQETAFAVSQYGLKQSNTMSYDGSAAGLAETFRSATASRTLYSKKVAQGEDVSQDFFSKSVEKL